MFWIVAGAVAVAAAGAALARVTLPGPTWVGVGVVAGVGVLAAFFKPLMDAVAEVNAANVRRDAELHHATKELIARHGGPDGRFRRVDEIRTHAILYGVQQAIPLADDAPTELSRDLPKYVPRATDVLIHAKLTSRSATGGMVVIKGDSTWGKTRSLLEGVAQVLGDWSIVAPSSATEIEELVGSSVELRRTVIWLDELKDYLDSPEPLDLSMVKRTVSRGAIIVGTIWKSDFKRLTESPRVEPSRFRSRLGGPESTTVAPTPGEQKSARELLRSPLLDILEMHGGLNNEERLTATAVSQVDPRWAEALEHEGDLGAIQALAAAQLILGRYRRPDDAVGGAVLRAAVELLAIGHPEPVPVALLEVIAQPMIPDALWPTLDEDTWFSEAVTWACEAVRGPERGPTSIAALRRQSRKAGETVGFSAPDLLVQEAERSIPDKIGIDLALVLAHAAPDACAAIGRYFFFRDEDDAARPFIRRAANEGISSAFRPMGYLTKDVPEAEKWYLKAIDADRKDVAAYRNLGRLKLDSGDVIGARGWLKKAIGIDPKNVTAMVDLGLLEGEVGETILGREWFKKALDIDPDYATAMTGLGFLDRHARDIVSARTWFEKALDADPDFTGAMAGLGLLDKEAGDSISARAWFEKALDADPAYAAVMDSLGDLEEDAGNPAAARAWYEKALETDPSYATAMVDLGQLDREAGDSISARTWFEKALETDARNAYAMCSLGGLEKNAGNPAAARAWYEKALKADPSYAAVMDSLGDLEKDAGNPAAARAWYEKAVETDPTYAIAMVDLGELDRSAGDTANARAWYEKALETDPREAYAMGCLGDIEKESDNTTAARAWYEKALEADPAYAAVMVDLGRLDRDAGDTDNARAWFKKALEVDPLHADAIDELGTLD